MFGFNQKIVFHYVRTMTLVVMVSCLVQGRIDHKQDGHGQIKILKERFLVDDDNSTSQTSSPSGYSCSDHPDANCQLLKSYICQDPEASVKFCALTCNKCVPCLDDPEVNCALLKSYICNDPVAGRKFCALTCNMCESLSTYPNTQSTTGYTTPATTTTSIKTTTTPFWLPWGEWECIHNDATCYYLRRRNCSSGNENDCPGDNYILSACENGACRTTTTGVSLQSTDTTTPANTATTPKTSTTATTTQQSPFWLPWGEWNCIHVENHCFLARYRNCSTDIPDDCDGQSSSLTVCPNNNTCDVMTSTSVFTSASTTQSPHVTTSMSLFTSASTTHSPNETCQDYSNVGGFNGCKSPELEIICAERSVALQYCRKSCRLCNVDPQNDCGDSVSSAECDHLQKELCICSDPTLRTMCKHYCNNQCVRHPLTVDRRNCTAVNDEDIR